MFTESHSNQTFSVTEHFILVLKVWERLWIYKKIKLLKFEGDWGEL